VFLRAILTFAFYSLTIWAEAQRTVMALTRRQKQVYDFISNFVDAHGYSPSFEEIAEGLGLSSLARSTSTSPTWSRRTAASRLQSQPLDRSAETPRVDEAIAAVAAAAAAESNMSLPLLGRIAAGQPLEAVETGVDFACRFHPLQRSLRAASERREHAGRTHPRWRLLLVEKANSARDVRLLSPWWAAAMPR